MAWACESCVGGSGCHRLRLGAGRSTAHAWRPGWVRLELGVPVCWVDLWVREAFREGTVSNAWPHVQLPGDCATSSEAEVQGAG